MIKKEVRYFQVDTKQISNDPFTEKFKEEFGTYFYVKKKHKILIGVSGGLDSVALLLLLHYSLKNHLVVAHINHSLRKKSNQDLNFVKRLCLNLKVQFHSAILDPKTKLKNQSTEEWAREERYNFFRNIAKKTKSDWIMTGHHGNDQLETVLINLARQTGVSGLLGIAKKNGMIIRPLLPFSKIELVDFAKRIGFKYLEDSTNHDISIPRNFLRKKIVQPWENQMPHIIKGSYHSVQHFKEWKEALDYFILDLIIPTLNVSENMFEIPKSMVKKMPKMAVIRLIQILIYEEKKLWSKHEIKMLDHFINNKLKTSSHKLFKDWFLIYHRKMLIGQKVLNFSKGLVNIEADVPIVFNNSRYDILLNNKKKAKIDGQNTESVDWSVLKNKTLQIRIWKSGDFFQPLGMKGNQKISDFLINNKIDPLSKKSQSVLIADGKIAWVCGLRISDWIKVTNKTSEKVILRYIPIEV